MNALSRLIENGFSLPAGAWPAGLLALAGVVAGCGGSPEASPEHAGPVAQVQAVRVRQDTLAQTISAYGTVRAAPGGGQTFSAPFESRVRQVLVRPGEAVERGAPLVRLAPSPDAQEQIEQAKAALNAAQEQLKSVQKRYDLQLATRQELAAQKQAYQKAKARYTRVKSWQNYGRIAAPAPGVVQRVSAAEGALVPAGNALVTLALKGRFEARLGVEPADAARVQVGQRVHVEPVGGRAGARGLRGTVRSVTERVDSVSRRVDVVVALPGRSDRLVLGQYVRGRIEVTSARGLIVPRSALLPEQGRYALFTLHGGRAARHPATLEASRDSLALVVSAGVSAGDSVAVLGNYELKDHMRVRVQSMETSGPGAATRGSSSYEPASTGDGPSKDANAEKGTNARSTSSPNEHASGRP